MVVIFHPLPPCQVEKSADFVPVICFLVTPLNPDVICACPTNLIEVGEAMWAHSVKASNRMFLLPLLSVSGPTPPPPTTTKKKLDRLVASTATRGKKYASLAKVSRHLLELGGNPNRKRMI